MRRLKIAVCLIFILSCILYGGYTVKAKFMEDHTAPVITCDKDTISVSVTDEESALLDGVKAEDKEDGDLTKYIRIDSMSHFIANGKRTVTYVVFDQANQAGTLKRTVEYSDYEPPRIHLTKPLRITVAEIGKESLTTNMTAEDCLDGDLTSQIRVSYGDAYDSSLPGNYTVTAQVSNSAGDTCTLPLELVLTGKEDGGEGKKEYPLLSEYIVYTPVNQKIDPMAYVTGMEMNGIEYTYEKNGDMLKGTEDGIAVTSNVDYSNPGVYTVEYAYTASGAATAVTKLYVVVEGEQDGELQE